MIALLTACVWIAAGLALLAMLACVFWPWPKRIDWKKHRERRESLPGPEAERRMLRRLLMQAKPRMNTNRHE